MYKWNEMTNQEKNLLIAQDVLQFDCFKRTEGIAWYEKHYDLGQWRYCSRLSDAMDLAERILQDKTIQFQIVMSNENYECSVLQSNATNTPSYKANAKTLPEVICLAALFTKNIQVITA